LIGDAALVVLPSECYENFPRVVAEAFARGTPVVASNLGAMARVVSPGRTGLLFAPGSAADLAAQVGRVFADPPQRERMRQAAREEFELHYTAEANYRSLMGIYERAGGLS
jgi:glycosyltransferase involved in cell wall biosynthesis